ncbi:MAG: GIY-YIG nuclease family protein [Proteobacteria bacterium]|nr:GIY-YIG nuclease family protein [Pseudomonadota bacterium]
MPLAPRPAVYMETNRPNGTLYLGSTSNLAQRHAAHARGSGSKFTTQYALHHLVWFEHHPTEQAARDREFQLKEWRRAWKIRLILQTNPAWNDLSKE